jgi:hypothetical protein
MGEERNAYRLSVGTLKERRPLGRPRHRYLNNIELNLREIGWGGIEWIGVVQHREKWRDLVNAVMSFRVS